MCLNLLYVQDERGTVYNSVCTDFIVSMNEGCLRRPVMRLVRLHMWVIYDPRLTILKRHSENGLL